MVSHIVTHKTIFFEFFPSPCVPWELAPIGYDLPGLLGNPPLSTDKIYAFKIKVTCFNLTLVGVNYLTKGKHILKE